MDRHIGEIIETEKKRPDALSHNTTLAVWLAVHSAPQMGAATLRKLLTRFGDVMSILGASEIELLRYARQRRDTVAGLIDARRNMQEHEKLARLLARQSIHFLTRADTNYPARFLQLTTPPETLYCQGTLPGARDQTIAIVGTTQPSESGRREATRCAEAFTRAGWWIVSGFAKGIDMAAHTGCLRANGRTIAILPCGILQFRHSPGNPNRHTLALRGAMLSEFFPKDGWSVANAMARNRLIAGLADMVVVAETKGGGGSFRTAEVARRLGKEVLLLKTREGPDRVHAAPFLDVGARLYDAAQGYDALALRPKTSERG